MLLWPLSWVTKFSGTSASRSLEIQVFLTEWLVTFFSFSFLFYFFRGVPSSTKLLHLSVDYATQFLEAQLDYIGVAEFSCFKKGILFVFRDGLSSLRFVSFPVLVNKWLSLRCKDFLDFSNSLSLSMLNRYFFSLKYRCILCWKLETVTGSYSSLFFLRAFQKKISTKAGQARTQVSFQFSHFSYN